MDELLTVNGNIDNIKLLIYSWYKQIGIRYEIVRYLHNREFSVINKATNERIPMLKCHNVQNFDFLVNHSIKMEEHNEVWNLYYSIAKYANGIPNQHWLRYKNKEINDAWKLNHFEQMIEYTFFLDIDCNSHDEIDYAYESAKDIKSWMDNNKWKYELRFSGCGFHFIVPGLFKEKSFNPKEKDSVYYNHIKLAKFFHNDFSELIDSTIYDSRRLCKVPYSLAYYPKIDKAYLCFPFHSDEQFSIFHLRFLDASNLLAAIYQKRGDYIFNGQLDVRDCFTNLKDFGGVI